MTTVCKSFQLHKLVNFNTRQAATLDNIYSDLTDYSKNEVQKLPPLIGNEGDHCCIYMPSCHTQKHRYQYKTIRVQKKDSMFQLTKELVDISWQEIYDEHDINKKAEKFQLILRGAADRACPLKTIRVREDNPPWENHLSCKIRRARDRAYKKGAHSYKYLSKILKGIIAKNKKHWISRTINSLSNGDKRWWQRIKKLSGKSKCIPDCTMIDDVWYRNYELATLLNTHFANVGGELQDVVELSTVVDLESTDAIEVSHGLVKAELRRIKVSKSVSSEDFPPWISREFADIVCEPLTDIINAMFRQNKFPNVWKKAEVVPLPKIKTPAQSKDFRPISLLFHCGKVAEKFFMAEYKKQVLPRISNQQFAYRPTVGTTDALIYTIEKWTHMMDDKNTRAVEVVFKDFSKAFDSLQPNMLMSALNNLDVTSKMKHLCLDFLTNRQQRVKIKNQVSSYIPAGVGVPQGTLSGPMFWLAFVNSYTPPGSVVTMYADDITCSAAISNAEDSCIQAVVEWGLSWCAEHSMTLNLSKTKAMFLTLGPNSKTPPCTLSSPVEIVNSWKFLGVFIDKFLNFEEHTNYITNKAKTRFYALLQLKRMGIAQEKLCLFYTANVRSVLTYCMPAFYSLLTAKQINEIEKIQRQCTKIILPAILSYNERLEILGIPELSDFSLELCRNHFLKILGDQDHQLHMFLPERQSESRRHSKRLKDSFLVGCRTSKRSKSFFIYGAKNFL